MGLLDYLIWHYYQGNKFILKVTENYLEFSFHVFSVRYLLRTLFTPWRRVEKDSKVSEGALEKLSFNLISRGIGLFVRLIFISFGLLLAVFFLGLGLLFLAFWQVMVIFSLPFYFYSNQPQPDRTKLEGKARQFVFERFGVKDETELNAYPKEDILGALSWYWLLYGKKSKQQRFWEKANLLRFPAFGHELSFGFTPELDKYSEDLAAPSPFYHQLVGREKVISQIESILSRSAYSNCLLVGEPGVGKRTILQAFAKAVAEKRIIPELFFKRVLLLNMHFLLGNASMMEEARAKFLAILKEAEAAGNIILVITNIEKYLSADEDMDLTSSFSFMAQSKRIQVIGVTTPDNYERYIFPNDQVAKFFERIDVVPATKAEALEILEVTIPDFEAGKRAIVSFPAASEIITQCDALITNIPFPEKAIDLVDRLITDAQASHKYFIAKSDVDKMVALKTKIPVGSISESEQEKLKNLEDIVRKRLIGQETAVEALVSAMKRSRLGISDSQKPIGTFLFLGPTGVGKTELAKALAEGYFGSEKQMIRFDMSQFQDASAITTLIGSSQSDKPGLLINEIREKPYSVLLLDEFEKARKEILNIFLTVFDEGYIKDANGKIASFRNVIIICTSNAGAELIRQTLQAKPKIDASQFKTMVTEYVLKQGIFSPELLNRYDEVVVFKPLELGEIEEVAKLQLERLKERLQKREIKLLIDQPVFEELAKQGHSFEFGARPMKRLISDKIETQIANEILENTIKNGDSLKLTLDLASKEFKIER